jgi:hypothetical protein
MLAEFMRLTNINPVDKLIDFLEIRSQQLINMATESSKAKPQMLSNELATLKLTQSGPRKTGVFFNLNFFTLLLILIQHPSHVDK